jgi:hypothetical protein
MESRRLELKLVHLDGTPVRPEELPSGTKLVLVHLDGTPVRPEELPAGYSDIEIRGFGPAASAAQATAVEHVRGSDGQIQVRPAPQRPSTGKP